MSSHAYETAALAALLADPTRAGVCLALADGRAWTASELCRHTGVGASTMSAHLGRLVGGGVLVERRQGRHRYVALADEGIAALVEALAARAAPTVCGTRWRGRVRVTTIWRVRWGVRWPRRWWGGGCSRPTWG